VLNARFGKYLSVDGKIGPQTISAINSVPAEALNDALYQARVSFLKSIVTRFPNQEVFLKGWLRRAADIAGK
jgi:type VI secretion system secreted protein VgrG